MNRQETIDKLTEVKNLHLPHMTYAKFKEYYGDLSSFGFEETDENIKIMDDYLNIFLDSKNDYIGNGCWLCGNESVVLSWGLVHGEALSNCCGLSYRKYHYAEDICKEKKLFDGKFRIALQYHPDGFDISDNDEEDADEN